MKQNIPSFWQKWALALMGIAFKFLKMTPKSVKSLRKTKINNTMVHDVQNLIVTKSYLFVIFRF